MKEENYNNKEETETIQYDFVKPANLQKTTKPKSFLFIITLLIIVFGVFLIIFKKQGYNFLIKKNESLEIIPNVQRIKPKDSKKLNQVKENSFDKWNKEKKIRNNIDGKKGIDKNKKEKSIKVKRESRREKNSQIPLKKT